jgi:hypothetical protein
MVQRSDNRCQKSDQNWLCALPSVPGRRGGQLTAALSTKEAECKHLFSLESRYETRILFIGRFGVI